MATFPKRFVIVTHELVYGAPHALFEYLRKKKQSVYFIAHPLTRDTDKSYITYDQFRNKALEIRIRTIHLPAIQFCMDALLTSVWFLRYIKRADVYIGVNPLNCAIGLLLKKCRRVTKVIYYAIDFTPIRYTQALLNSPYRFLEKWCVARSDEVWDVSPRIQEGRQRFYNVQQPLHLRIVPIGYWSKDIPSPPARKSQDMIIFIGHLLKKQGAQIVVEALLFLKKKIPSIRFLIVGDGPYRGELNKQIEKLKLTEHVTLYGWETNRTRLMKCIATSDVGVACYQESEKDTANFTYYADPTKIKDYLACGVPVVLTNVPYNACDISRKKCGIVVRYDAKEVADALYFLLSDRRKNKQFQKNAQAYVKQFEWNLIFDSTKIV